MRHIRELTRNGVWLNDISIIILIPRLVDNYKIAVHVTVGKAVQVHKHAILIRRDVPAVIIKEFQNNFPIIVHSIVIHPIAGNQLQTLAIIEDVAGQLLAVLPPSRMEIDEEIDEDWLTPKSLSITEMDFIPEEKLDVALSLIDRIIIGSKKKKILLPLISKIVMELLNHKQDSWKYKYIAY